MSSELLSDFAMCFRNIIRNNSFGRLSAAEDVPFVGTINVFLWMVFRTSSSGTSASFFRSMHYKRS